MMCADPDHKTISGRWLVVAILGEKMPLIKISQQDHSSPYQLAVVLGENVLV